MKIRVVLASLVLCFGSVAAAQSQKQEKVDPAAEADIRRLIQMTGQSIKPGEIVRQMMPHIRASMAQYEKELPPERVEGMHRVMDRVMEKWLARLDQELGQIQHDMVPIYAKHFTPEEIKATIQFYESPAGRKWLAELPQIVQESMAVTFPRIQAIQQEMMRSLVEEMRKEFPDLPLPKRPDVKN